MFDKVKGGEIIDIQGVKCHVPNPPHKSEIQGSHLPKKEQSWKRTELPVFKALDIEWFSGEEPEDLLEIIDWDTAKREETIKQTGSDPWNIDRAGNPKVVKGIDPNPYYISTPLEDFRKQEIDRIYEGVWFMNNGKPTYVPGAYYFFLNWWKMDIGYAQFRIPDLQLFYLIEYVYEDPNCMGLLYITMRGVGKSVQAAALSYYMTITHEKSHIGIQSKTDADAEALFQSKIVEPYKDLPDFLIPINKNGTNPTAELNFSPPSKTGKNASLHKKHQKEALRSILTFRSAGNVAYDGETLKFLLQDEVGKVEEKIANVYKRWIVNRQCLFRDNRKRGIGFLTTTVEEMDKGGANCKKIWEESNQMKKNENHRTVSWCFRYFRSALDAANFDEYGYPDRIKNKLYHDRERSSLQHDPTALVSYIQKNPYDIEEAFMTMGASCIYNAAILQKRQVILSRPNHGLTVKGDFTWINGVKDTKVEFIRNDVNGMWDISYLNIREEEKNQLKYLDEIDGVKQWDVKKSGRYIGYDPYKSRKVVDERKKSDAAMAVYQDFDYHLEEDYCNTYIADFAGRYPTPEEAHEQCIMASVYFGAWVFPENQVIGAIEYIRNRGYYAILMDRPASTGNKSFYIEDPGMPSNTRTIDYYTGLTRTNIQYHGHKLKHIRIIKDFLDFDPTNTTKFDSAVAASYSVVAAQRPKDEPEQELINIGDIFGSTDHSGDSGKIN
tara:strand:- start:448 stop:2613 length:2166 start_codon:yes stop_codon:yes gene_type:complete